MDIVYRILALLGVLLIVGGVLKYLGVYHGSNATPLALIVVGVIVLVADHLILGPSGYRSRRRL